MMRRCNYSERVLCSKETKIRIENECKEEFIRNNPDFDGMVISNGFMIQKVVEYYLTHRCP
jgi:hypothetical protein